MSANDRISELEQEIADREAELQKLRGESVIWDKIFRENYWGMMICDANTGEFVKTNPFYDQMHGYEPSELIGRTIEIVFPPECRKDIPGLVEKIHREGHYDYDTVHIRKDGSRFPVHTDTYEVEILGKRFRVVAVWDITEAEQNKRELALYREYLEELLKSRTDALDGANEQLRIEMIKKEAMEKELAQANQELLNTLDSISDGFISVNRNWIITYANKAIINNLKRLGISENIVGSVFALSAWQREPMLWNSCQEVMDEGKPKRFELYSEQMEHWQEFSIYPSQQGILIFTRFIDERKALERMVEHEHHRLYSMFNAFPGMIFLLEESYQIRFANQNFIEKFGECVGEFCYSVIAGANLPCRDCMNTLVCENATSFRNERIFGQRTYEVYSQPYNDADGTSLIIKVLIDVTEGKNTDREFLRLQRLNLVGEMAAGVAHEVRNPLTTVRGFLQLLSSKDKIKDFRDYFQIMIEELDRASVIISDFLSLAREKPADYKPINLRDVIESLKPLLNADAVNQDKDIQFELEEVADFEGNESELRQLLLNLARNGFEAMSGGKALTIRTFEKEDSVILQVADPGEGIDPFILKNIGTPFLTTKERGTGLGIAICKSIAARHNAVISFDSDSRGTVVSVEFPMFNNELIPMTAE